MDKAEKLMWLRQDIIANTQLADNKAHNLMLTYREAPGMEQLYLEAISPNLDTPAAPEGYLIFNATEEDHVEYQCNICRAILLKKYEVINKMIKLAKAYLDFSTEITERENETNAKLDLLSMEYEDIAQEIIYGDKKETEEDE